MSGIARRWFMATITMLTVGLAFAQEKAADGNDRKFALEVAFWSPMPDDAPPYMFKMIHRHWPGDKGVKPIKREKDVEDYAREYIAEIGNRPKGTPVYILLQGWLGNYKPGWDHDSLIAHIGDATPQGTPGIWPDEGLKIWRDRQERFIKALKDAGAGLDFWVLDYELCVNHARDAWRGPDVFKNIVFDPRWKEKPIMGLGITGVQIFDPGEIGSLESDWTKSGLKGATRVAIRDGRPVVGKQGEKFRDSRLAHDLVGVLGSAMSHAAIDKALYEPIRAAYPNAVVSDYGAYDSKIDFDRLLADENTSEGAKLAYRKLREVLPDYKIKKGVGNGASPVFYIPATYHARYGYLCPDAKDGVDVMLRRIDELCKIYPPENIAPWVSHPWRGKIGVREEGKGNLVTYELPDGKRDFTEEQYERLILGCVERGVRRFLVWAGKDADNPNSKAEWLRVFKKAYELAGKRGERR